MPFQNKSIFVKPQVPRLNWKNYNYFRIRTRTSATDVRMRLLNPTLLALSSNLWVIFSWGFLWIWLPNFTKFAPLDLSLDERSLLCLFFELKASLYLSNLKMDSRNIFALSLVEKSMLLIYVTQILVSAPLREDYIDYNLTIATRRVCLEVYTKAYGGRFATKCTLFERGLNLFCAAGLFFYIMIDFESC